MCAVWFLLAGHAVQAFGCLTDARSHRLMITLAAKPSRAIFPRQLGHDCGRTAGIGSVATLKALASGGDMGTIVAVIGRAVGASLQHFHDMEVARVDLPEPGYWVLMGRVTVANYDGDTQLASAKIARLAPGPAGPIVQVI